MLPPGDALPAPVGPAAGPIGTPVDDVVFGVAIVPLVVDVVSLPELLRVPVAQPPAASARIVLTVMTPNLVNAFMVKSR